VLWLALLLMANAIKWLDGSQPLGAIDLLSTIGASDGVYFLALVHYLKGAADAAIHTFRPALAVSEAESNRLHYQLTTLPARRTMWVSVIAAALAGLQVLFNPDVPSAGYTSSLLATVFGSSIAVFTLTVMAALVYQTVHQLTMVGRIHAAATRINLFQPDPLYAFSGLTARTAMGYLVLADTALLAMNEFMSETDPLAAGMMVFMMLLAAVTFVLPLMGMHRRMVEEKGRLESEANRRLEAAIAELHRRVDAGEFSDMTEVYRAIGGLEIERDVLAKISTWPWQSGTLSVVISPVLLPVAVWIIQRLLERLGGF